MRVCVDRAALTLVCLALVACAAHGPRDPSAGPTPRPTGAVPLSDDQRHHYQRALAALAAGRPQAALPLLQALVQAHPRLPGLWHNLGLAHLAAGDAEAALEALRRAVALRPDDARLHNALGVALRRLGRLQEAEAAYRRALDLDPALAAAHRNLGILLDLYLDRPREAEAHYRRYLALRPEAASEVRPWLQELARRTTAGEGGP